MRGCVKGRELLAFKGSFHANGRSASHKSGSIRRAAPKGKSKGAHGKVTFGAHWHTGTARVTGGEGERLGIGSRVT